MGNKHKIDYIARAIERIKRDIRQYERSHGMTSEEMLKSDLDTPKTSRWRVLLDCLKLK